MRALIWKEFREKRIWLLPLIASTVGLVAVGYSYTFSAIQQIFHPLILLPSAIALLMGAATYSGELSGDTADFLYSRPIGWKRVLLAKLIVGAVIIAAAAVAAAVAYRFLCPEQYVRFATITNLTRGAGLAAALMAPPYLIGAACSVVLPGLVGGILTLLAAGVTLGAEVTVLGQAYGSAREPAIASLIWLPALLLAGLLVVRFGITLSTGARAKRYALILGVVVLAAAPADLMLDQSLLSSPSKEQYFNVSPDARYALVEEGIWGSAHWGRSGVYLVRLADRKKMEFDALSEPIEYFEWTPSGRTYCLMRGGLRTVWMDEQGLHEDSLELRVPGRPAISPSPAGDLAIAWFWEDDSPLATLFVIDVERLQVLKRLEHVESYWWQSPNEIGYRTPDGARKIVRVRN